MKFTEKDFKYFKNQVAKWLESLKQHHKNVYVTWEKLEPGQVAICSTLVENTTYAIVLGKDDIEISAFDSKEDFLNKTALHEVVHCAIAEFDAMATSRYVATQRDIAVENERLTELLTKVIYELDNTSNTRRKK